MKTPCRIMNLFGMLVLVLALAGRAMAQANANPPERMTYQGFLVDANGVALGNTAPRNYDVIFRMWTAQTGGSRLWSEQQTVTVDKGFFNVLLGEGSAVSGEVRPALSAVFSGADVSERYISVTVKAPGLGSSDVEITPRLRMMTAPYAFLAKQAVSVVNSSGTSLIQGNGNAIQLNVPVQSAGGNARGSSATDLQVTRGAVDQVASGNSSSIGGGANNRASGQASTVGGGTDNSAQNTRATVAGGGFNTATADNATVGGGTQNAAVGTGATVSGGTGNRANGTDSAVGGGNANTASGNQSVANGGLSNTASGERSTVGGGGNNTASGADSTVPGGRFNTASGAASVAAGFRAKATHNGAIVLSDATDADFNSQANNEMSVRANGGVRIAGTRPASSSALKQVNITDTQLNSPNFALQLGYRFQPGVMAQGLIEAVDNGNGAVLAIQPRGGSVSIGKDTVPQSALDVNGAVTATRFVGDGTIPVGGIIMWAGSIASIPSGWALCDGGNNTPDLRSRFVVGASSSTGPADRTRYDPGNTGGAEFRTLTVAQLPPHSHTVSDAYYSEYHGSNQGYAGSDEGYDWDNAPFERSINTGNTGSGASIDFRPPYFALAYIMRTR